MTIDECLDWMIDIEKCSDNIANEDVREMVAHHAREIRSMLYEERGLLVDFISELTDQLREARGE